MDILKLPEVIKDPDLKIKISELVSENLRLKEENFILKNSLKSLEKQNELASLLKFENNHYYLIKENTKEGPFCSKCWDSEKKLVRIHNGGSDMGTIYFTCPNCKTPTKST